MISHCPLPRFPLRNGSLNQLAYSLYFFFRDVTDGNFLGWLGKQVQRIDDGAYPDIERELITPMRSIHGISDKVISMALSDLFLASGWFITSCIEVVSCSDTAASISMVPPATVRRVARSCCSRSHAA